MFVKSPYLLKKLFPDLIWNVKTKNNEIFLTFDDGPHPEITPWVLELLAKYKAKATFFCVGDNVKKYPETYELILEKGHEVGNHSDNHLSGWKTENASYFENIKKAGEIINSVLFRPPYGRITPSQIKVLREKYSIVMWSVLSYDFSRNISEKQCLKNSIENTKPGSIVVFHDSLKSEKNLKYALPLFMEYFTDQGFEFKKLY